MSSRRYSLSVTLLPEGFYLNLGVISLTTCYSIVNVLCRSDNIVADIHQKVSVSNVTLHHDKCHITIFIIQLLNFAL